MEIPWAEFYERYTENFEEFLFWYKEYKINLCYGKNGSFSYNISNGKKLLATEDFKTPNELLENAKFDGKLIKEIYIDLE